MASFSRCAVVLVLTCCCTVAAQSYTATYLPGQVSYHQTGSLYDSTGWQVTVADTENAYATYGPYAKDVPAYTDIMVSFTLAIDNNNHDDATIAVLDVNDAASQTVLTNVTVLRTDFETPFEPQQFRLFARVPGGASLEYRVFYVCCAQLMHTRTDVQSLTDDGPMASFWNDTAHFAFVSKAQFPSPNHVSSMNVGFHFVPVGDVWYLFHREYYFEPQPAYCTADYARILVRSSRDRGVTWSNASVVVTPAPNTPFECAIVDGAAHFDANAGVWRYLGQCLARDDGWNMCLFTLNSAAPDAGPFTPAPGNPVVRSGQLWSSICGHAQRSHCGAGMGSEGTPEIVAVDAEGFFYVTFHGWDPSAVRSARGVAKTRDFSTWLTSGGGLPGDALFTAADCDAWSEDWAPGGCVGGGEGSMLASGDYRYHLIEAPDISLGCIVTPGQQNWVLGLSRAPAATFLPTTQWRAFRAVPTVVPAVKQGCYIQYHRLFADAYGAYLSFWADGWLQIFVLTPGAGALPIVAGPPPATDVGGT